MYSCHRYLDTHLYHYPEEATLAGRLEYDARLRMTAEEDTIRHVRQCKMLLQEFNCLLANPDKGVCVCVVFPLVLSIPVVV